MLSFHDSDLRYDQESLRLSQTANFTAAKDINTSYFTCSSNDKLSKLMLRLCVWEIYRFVFSSKSSLTRSRQENLQLAKDIMSRALPWSEYCNMLLEHVFPNVNSTVFYDSNASSGGRDNNDDDGATMYSWDEVVAKLISFENSGHSLEVRWERLGEVGVGVGGGGITINIF